MKNGFLAWLCHQDEKILACINKRLYHPRLKPLMTFFSNPPLWRQLFLLLLITLFMTGGRQTRLRVGLLLLSVILSDQTCNLLKAVFKRVRPDGPCRAEGNFWQRLGQYSLPSSHAANNFCLAVLVSCWLPCLTLPLFTWSFLVAFSRVWLKNHYPLDVFLGALIGLGYGFLFLWVSI